MSKSIVLTGGGTAGHVTPNLALLPHLAREGYQVSYIGSHDGIERRLAEESSLPYYHISTGKFRRYFDLKNFTDPFRVVKGFFDARRILAELKPDVIFSKGGFVSVPVIWAARTLGIPCIIHESDMTPGLANRLSIPAATYVCCNFPETLKLLPAGRARLTGSPIRQSVLEGSRERGLSFCGFGSDKPVILVMGGSLGALSINKAVRDAIHILTADFSVVHICGRGKLDETLTDLPSYRQFEYVGPELGDIMAMADLVVSRAGANSICEFQALKKPMLLIPLPAKSSRGDQLLNAASFEAQGFSITLPDEKLGTEELVTCIWQLWNDRERHISAMAASPADNAAQYIFELIKSLA